MKTTTLQCLVRNLALKLDVAQQELLESGERGGQWKVRGWRWSASELGTFANGEPVDWSALRATPAASNQRLQNAGRDPRRRSVLHTASSAFSTPRRGQSLRQRGRCAVCSAEPETVRRVRPTNECTNRSPTQAHRRLPSSSDEAMRSDWGPERSRPECERQCFLNVLGRRRRSQKPSPSSFFFRLLDGPSEKRSECAQECAPTTVPQTRSKSPTQSTRVIAFSVKGVGLNTGRLQCYAIERTA